MSSYGSRTYKCFGGDGAGYEALYPVNIIIGRNNSGKSSLLDILDYAISPQPIPASFAHQGLASELFLTSPLRETELRQVFPENSSGGDIRGNHWRDYGIGWVEKPLTRVMQNNQFVFKSVLPPFTHRSSGFGDQLAKLTPLPFTAFVFKRLRADRDVAPESYSPSLNIQSNGIGLTNVIQNYITRADCNAQLSRMIFSANLTAWFDPMQSSPGYSFSSSVMCGKSTWKKNTKGVSLCPNQEAA
jgi:hypothetical protein